MVDPQSDTPRPDDSAALDAEAARLDDAAAMALLTAEDPASLRLLAAWLRARARTFAPVVEQAFQEGVRPSPAAAGTILDGMAWRTSAKGEATLTVMQTCIEVIASRITDSLARSKGGAISDGDDALVGAAVTVLTSSCPSRHSAMAIGCLTESGPGGALILARSFDAVRSALKVSIVRDLKPADVLELDDNVVASLARSVTKLADELEGPQRDLANRFLAALGPVEHLEPAEVSARDSLEAGDRVFHASWGTGTVVSATAEAATIDFGSAGTRTLLRSLTTLRRAE